MNTAYSLDLMLEMWTHEQDYQVAKKRGAKRNERDMAQLARMAALASYMLAELNSDPTVEQGTVDILRKKIISWCPTRALAKP